MNCNSADGFILFVDDVRISSGNGFGMNTIPSGPEVSYLVSVDGEKRDITDESFYFSAMWVKEFIKPQ